MNFSRNLDYYIHKIGNVNDICSRFKYQTSDHNSFIYSFCKNVYLQELMIRKAVRYQCWATYISPLMEAFRVSNNYPLRKKKRYTSRFVFSTSLKASFIIISVRIVLSTTKKKHGKISDMHDTSSVWLGCL